MASFDLQWRKSTSKDLRRIPREAVSRIVDAVAKLAEEPLPHGSEKLTGSALQSSKQFRRTINVHPLQPPYLTILAGRGTRSYGT
jgi:mRNA-degrading endonuclease RelE of RelBE toxin-antitoxin system